MRPIRGYFLAPIADSLARIMSGLAHGHVGGNELARHTKQPVPQIMAVAIARNPIGMRGFLVVSNNGINYSLIAFTSDRSGIEGVFLTERWVRQKSVLPPHPAERVFVGRWSRLRGLAVNRQYSTQICQHDQALTDSFHGQSITGLFWVVPKIGKWSLPGGRVAHPLAILFFRGRSFAVSRFLRSLGAIKRGPGFTRFLSVALSPEFHFTGFFMGLDGAIEQGAR